METILIATDFSSAARNATIYGFELARLIQAKVILFTAYQSSIALPDSAIYLSSNEMERNSYKQLLDEAEVIDPRRTVALKTQSRQGPVSASILSAALENNVSFIIVGMKKHGKEIRKCFGSTVTDLYKTSGIPLIVVPAEAVFSIPETIALASDITDDTDLHALNPLKKIGEIFVSRLFVVRVIKKFMDGVGERVMRSERLNSFLASLDTSFKFIRSENVAKALNTFVDEHSVNMVAVIPHEHTVMERLFTRSVTKDLVFHTHVPLLILPSYTLDKIGRKKGLSVELDVAV
jgi:nucleotide-binding universal stress UspA family protein